MGESESGRDRSLVPAPASNEGSDKVVYLHKRYGVRSWVMDWRPIHVSYMEMLYHFPFS
jgi:hypothetical protein